MIEGREVGDVGLHERSVGKLVRDALTCVGVTVGHDDVKTAIGEPPGRRGTETRGASHHEC